MVASNSKAINIYTSIPEKKRKRGDILFASCKHPYWLLILNGHRSLYLSGVGSGVNPRT